MGRSKTETETTTPRDTKHTPEEATKLRQEMREVMQHHTTACILLASKLFDVYYGTVTKGTSEVPLYLAWGHDTFDEYTEHELGIHQGTARVYVGLFDELYCRRQFDPKDLPDSITKLKGLAKLSRRLNNKREVEDWVAKSKKLSCCEFDAEVEAVVNGRRKGKPVSIVMSWNGTKTLHQCLTAAKERYGVSTKGDALLRVVKEWRAQNGAGVAASGSRATRKRAG